MGGNRVAKLAVFVGGALFSLVFGTSTLAKILRPFSVLTSVLLGTGCLVFATEHFFFTQAEDKCLPGVTSLITSGWDELVDCNSRLTTLAACAFVFGMFNSFWYLFGGRTAAAPTEESKED